MQGACHRPIRDSVRMPRPRRCVHCCLGSELLRDTFRRALAEQLRRDLRYGSRFDSSTGSRAASRLFQFADQIPSARTPPPTAEAHPPPRRRAQIYFDPSSVPPSSTEQQSHTYRAVKVSIRTGQQRTGPSPSGTQFHRLCAYLNPSRVSLAITLIITILHLSRKLLHQRVEGKEVSQEENFLPKHQRVKDLCQRAEYQTPCQQIGQKWQCVEDATGKLRLFKCKNEGGGAKNFQRGVAGNQRPISIKSQLYNRNLDACDCDFRDLRPLNLRPSMMRPFNKKPFLSKKKFKALKSYSRNRYTRSISMASLMNGYPGNHSLTGGSDDSEDEFSGMGGAPSVVAPPNSIKVTHRCSILSNATVKCDTGVYQSLQAWKDHKLHIDHEIETLQTKIKNLREVRGHLKKARPLECDCNKYLYKSKLKNKLRYRGGSLHPF
ncbi:extracellular sulfatase Sulf-2-like isoform X3, partial [Lates japonicus]